MSKENLQKLFQGFVEKNQLPKAIISIEKGNGQEVAQFEHGPMTDQTPFLLASVTKMWVTTLILQLIDQGKISYTNIVTDFIEKEKLSQINHYMGKDQTEYITIKDLLFQRSGLANIFFEEPISLRQKIAEADFSYTFDDMLDWVRQSDAHFLPGSDQAHYADINFMLLGEIIEKIHHLSLDDCIDRFIMEPLGLNRSYLVSSEFGFIPPLYTGKDYLYRPKIVASAQGAGGGVSTTADTMTFIRAFIQGDLFDKNHWQEMQDYYPLQGDYAPVEYGGGHMKLSLGQFNKEARLSFIGHSGISGAFAFYCPQLDVYLAGTTDNVGKSELCIQLIYLMLFELEKDPDFVKQGGQND